MSGIGTARWRNWRLPGETEVELLPIRCADFATMYSVRLTSIGSYRLFGYLSIPQGTGPFPGDLLSAEVSKRA